MASMNLLQAGFNGKLGVLTGVKSKAGYVIKSKIWSKAPPTVKQTENVRAFEALNRVAGALARIGYEYLGLDNKKLLNHNNVAKLLKPIIREHSFEPFNANSVIPDDGSLMLEAFSYDSINLEIDVRIGLGSEYVPLTGSKIFLLIFNQFGQIQFGELYDAQQLVLSLPIKYAPEYRYSIFAFISDPAARGYYLHGLVYREDFQMRYSKEWQITGDEWLDGKPIYQITVEVALAGSVTNQHIEIPLGKTLETIIDYKLHNTSWAQWPNDIFLTDGYHAGNVTVDGTMIPNVRAEISLWLNKSNMRTLNAEIFSQRAGGPINLFVTIFATLGD
jgi:hypothetical protein